MQRTITKAGSRGLAGWSWLASFEGRLWLVALQTVLIAGVTGWVVWKNWSGPAHAALVPLLIIFPVGAAVIISISSGAEALLPTRRKAHRDLHRGWRWDQAILTAMEAILLFCLGAVVSVFLYGGS